MKRFWGAVACLIVTVACQSAWGQSYGLELHNSMMPASGALAGTSLSRPQDVQSAINGNPATLSQFRGTQFSFSGSWLEATYRVNQPTPLPLAGVTPFESISGTPGSNLGNIGIAQDFGAFGLPATVGLGFVANAGAGVDFRDVPQSNGTSAHYIALDAVMGVGIDLTERISVGGSVVVGTGLLDGPFTAVGGMVPDYALRSTLGTNFQLTDATSLGAYWQSRKRHTFDDAALIGGQTFDIALDHPANIGLGLANDALLNGRLLLMSDLIYKVHSNGNFIEQVYRDQWVWTMGAQLQATERVAFRIGYGYNTNPMRDAVTTSAGGVPLPDGIPALRYVQSQFASVSMHRLTAGFGFSDVLPGIDLDVFGGGMFENSANLGTTTVSLEGYWVGAGLTWRFGRGACEDLDVADDWCR